MHNKEFKYLYRSWNTACGIHNGIDDKIWLLDIDNKDEEYSKKVKMLHLCTPSFPWIPLAAYHKEKFLSTPMKLFLDLIQNAKFHI